MKKVFKIILTIFCWICAIICFMEALKSFNNLDPWGLEFTFYTLPIGILGILFVIIAVHLTKKLIKNKK